MTTRRGGVNRPHLFYLVEGYKKNNLLEVNELRSLVLMSDSTKYRVSILPKISQISPIKDIQHLDFNNDSNYDYEDAVVAFAYASEERKG